MWKKLLLALCLGGFTLHVAAADQGVPPQVDATIRAALAKFASKVVVDTIEPAPLPGFYQVIASGQLVYISADGKYMLNGDLVDIDQHKSLSDIAWARFRKAELAKVPAARRIVFAPPHPKTTLTVFTDVNCGYCRELHKHIAEFNQAGIAVEYLAWPREGVSTTAGRPTRTYTEMVSVWCAGDRKAAFDEAIQSQEPKPATCANPVKDQFNLGVRLGVTGTPTIVTQDGRVIGGYITAQQALDDLKKHPLAGG